MTTATVERPIEPAAIATARAIGETEDRHQRRQLAELTKALHRHHIGHYDALLEDDGTVWVCLNPSQLRQLIEALGC